MDYVTVLTWASDRFATKQRIWMESAQQWHTISYDKAYWFGYGRAEVDGINRLGELLEWARDKPHTLFIRGDAAPGVEVGSTVRRNYKAKGTRKYTS